MGKLLYFGIFMASLDPTYETASGTAGRALLETPMMKEELRILESDSEKVLFQYTGLSKEELAYAGYAYPVLVGKFSTKPFKNLKYETKYYTLIPELEYELNSKGYSATVYLNFKADF